MGSSMYSNLEYDKGGILNHKGGKERLGIEWGWDLSSKKQSRSLSDTIYKNKF